MLEHGFKFHCYRTLKILFEIVCSDPGVLSGPGGVRPRRYVGPRRLRRAPARRAPVLCRARRCVGPRRCGPRRCVGPGAVCGCGTSCASVLCRAPALRRAKTRARAAYNMCMLAEQRFELHGCKAGNFGRMCSFGSRLCVGPPAPSRPFNITLCVPYHIYIYVCINT